jgi:hypothetical protein
MAINVQHLLSRPMDSVKKPPTKPAGTYNGIIAGFKFAESKVQKTPYVRFTINNVTPGQDIAPDQQLDADGQPIDFSKWIPHKDFFLTDDALFRLKSFLEEGLQLPCNGRQFVEVLPDTKGMPVMFTATQRTSDDGKEIYIDIGDVVKA